jgi:hypothetical protein
MKQSQPDPHPHSFTAVERAANSNADAGIGIGVKNTSVDAGMVPTVAPWGYARARAPLPFRPFAAAHSLTLTKAPVTLAAKSPYRYH